LAGLNNKTIVALSTPVGLGGIAVIRISGPACLNVLKQISHKNSDSFDDHVAVYTPFYSKDGIEIDRGIALYFKAPHSYTGEDVVELSTHGGFHVPKTIIETCLSIGCEPAGPGEFTKRAFLNGKLDLSQAEAVADVIMSKTVLSHKMNYRMLRGNYSQLIKKFKKKLFGLITLIEAELDFSDEEITSFDDNHKLGVINDLSKYCERLLSTFKTGRILNEGGKITIIGETNVGKSSLLNSVLLEDRIIVTDVPGTTRDSVEVSYTIDNIPVRFFDTAGLRETGDIIESSGIKKSKENARDSDLVLWVFDVSASDLKDIIKIIKKPFFSCDFIVVLNKADLVYQSELDKFHVGLNGMANVITSAKSGRGIELLLKEIKASLINNDLLSDDSVIMTNPRHKKALLLTLESLYTARKIITSKDSSDVLASVLREALWHLDFILGITTADDILNNIFSKFCIGK
tara:strand:- start:18737 stop:20116 length:1380 start_codon:yes stop_codon:yes gene_type:complete